MLSVEARKESKGVWDHIQSVCVILYAHLFFII